jgi:hypothetical protein
MAALDKICSAGVPGEIVSYGGSLRRVPRSVRGDH